MSVRVKISGQGARAIAPRAPGIDSIVALLGHFLPPHISICELRSGRRPRRIWITETTMLSSRMTIEIAVA